MQEDKGEIVVAIKTSTGRFEVDPKVFVDPNEKPRHARVVSPTETQIKKAANAFKNDGQPQPLGTKLDKKV